MGLGSTVKYTNHIPSSPKLERAFPFTHTSFITLTSDSERIFLNTLTTTRLYTNWNIRKYSQIHLRPLNNLDFPLNHLLGRSQLLRTEPYAIPLDPNPPFSKG